MRKEAIATLKAAGIAVGQKFESLNADQVAAIRAEAEAMHQRKYGKPIPAASTDFVRKRYEVLQQRAAPRSRRTPPKAGE